MLHEVRISSLSVLYALVVLAATSTASSAIGQPVPIWSAQYNGTGNGLDYGGQLRLDSKQNIIVGLSSYGLGSGQDIAVVKYSLEGKLHWTSRYTGPGIYNDGFRDIAIDSKDNIVVGGHTYMGPGRGWDGIVIKYSPDGEEMWIRYINGLRKVSDSVVGIAVDAHDNIAVATMVNNSILSGDDILISLFSPIGELMWERTLALGQGINESPISIAVDRKGWIAVTGTVFEPSRPGSHILTVLYDHRGNQKWMHVYGLGTASTSSPCKVEFDERGNILVAGSLDSWPLSNSDGVFIKFYRSGDVAWTKIYDSPAHGLDSISDFVLNAKGHIVAIGSTSTRGADYLIIKVGIDGRLLWESVYDGPQHMDDRAHSVAVDRDGNIYLTGQSWDNLIPAHSSFATLKLDSDGNQLWVDRYRGKTIKNGEVADEGNSILIDKRGGIVVNGRSRVLGSGYDNLTMRYLIGKSKERGNN